MTKDSIYNILEIKNSDEDFASKKDLLVVDVVHSTSFERNLIDKYHVNMLCRKGSGLFCVENKIYQVSPYDIVLWSVDMNVSEIWFSRDFEGEALLMSRSFLLENNPEPSWATRGYLYIKESPVIHLNQSGFQRISSDFKAISHRLQNQENCFYRNILGKYLQIFLLDLWNICKSEFNRSENLNRNVSGLFSRFIQLVQQEAFEHREVSYYADKLCVTPKYLSEISRKASGKTAMYWINGFSIQTIIDFLKHSEMTISEISDKGGFYSLSHFSRYFKKLIGISPTEYRTENEIKTITEGRQ